MLFPPALPTTMGGANNDGSFYQAYHQGCSLFASCRFQQLDLGGVCPAYGHQTNVLLMLRHQCAIVSQQLPKESAMKWSTPKVKEVCIGMEINDYFPAEL
jgi:coenzyme PQQ precursor peptide PqqA